MYMCDLLFNFFKTLYIYPYGVYNIVGDVNGKQM